MCVLLTTTLMGKSTPYVMSKHTKRIATLTKILLVILYLEFTNTRSYTIIPFTALKHLRHD